MTDTTVETTVSGGQIQGVASAGTVHIENFTINNRAVEEPAGADVTEERIAPCPYPGLAYFGPGDADLFFGRDTAIARLADAVGEQSLTALVGASGSGKSSVVLAGLAPRLHAAGGWRFSHFRIGTELDKNPFLAIARSLVPLYVATHSDTDRLLNTKQLAESLETGQLTLRDVFADCRSRNKGTRILLIADQFEEAFTLLQDETLRSRFIDLLLSGFADPTSGSSPEICLILTLRADFYGHALRHRPLADALQGHVENLGSMNREELQAAISRPAESAKVFFEPGLVDTLLDDVKDSPGSLPLLQFALREMWGRQEQRKITRKSYDDIGRIEGALAQRAETIFGAMTENGANPKMGQIFQRLFTRLVTFGEGQEDTRRVVDRRELGDDVWSLAQRLAGEDNRLVVTNAPAFSRETAELAHEALIRHWPKLVDWIGRDRAFQSWLRQIRSSIELWMVDPADDGALLRGGMLAQGTEWLERRRGDFGPFELAYIEASAAASEKRQRQAHRAALRLRISAFVFLALFIGSSLLAVGLVGAFSEAKERSQAAHAAARESARQTARAQAALAKIENDGGRYFEAASAALAGLAVPLRIDTDSDQKLPWIELVRAAAADRFLVPPLQHDQEVIAAAFNRTGERVITLTRDVEDMFDEGHRTARIWDARSGDQIGKPLAPIHSAVFNPTGERIATASLLEKNARIWDARTGEPIGKPLEHEGPVVSAVFDPTGESIVTASEDKTARIWDARTGEPIGKPLQHLSPVVSAVFDPTGERIVTASEDKTARIWDGRSGEPIGKPLEHEGPVVSAVFDPTGECIVTASKDGTARIWDGRSGEPIGKPLQLEGPAESAAFDPSGERIITISKWGDNYIWDPTSGKPIGEPLPRFIIGTAFDPRYERVVVVADGGNTVRIWNLTLGTPTHTLFHEGRVWNAMFDPTGQYVVTASRDNDKAAHIWDASSGRRVGKPLLHESGVWNAAFDFTGERIVTASADKTARIWDFSKPTSKLLRHGNPVWDAAFDPAGKRIVTASGNNAWIWDVHSGEFGKPLQHDGQVKSATFDPKGERVLTASEDDTARIWNALTGEPIGKVLQHTGAIEKAIFDPTGERVLTLAWDQKSGQTARIWDVRSDAPTSRLLQHEGQVLNAAFDPTGERIVTASKDKTARIWDARSGKPIGKSLQHEGEVRSATFDPTGERIVTASEDKTARIWDGRTGEPIGKPLQHPHDVATATFDPRGERIVTTTMNGMVAFVWDARSGLPVGKNLQQGYYISAAAFDPTGDRIVTASQDKTARIWDALTGEPLSKPLQHEDEVTLASFDSAGEHVITVSTDAVRIWDAVPTGSRLMNLVRAKLGEHAPKPLGVPDEGKSKTTYYDLFTGGFYAIWVKLQHEPSRYDRDLE